MNVLIVEYGTGLVSIMVALGLSVVLYILSMVVMWSDVGDEEKRSVYECGFDPFEDTRNVFDVRFYLVGILFLIFDMEIMFLVPWSLTLKYIRTFGYIIMLGFLWILVLGYIYEWKKGALDW